MKSLTRILQSAALLMATALFAVGPALAASTTLPSSNLHLMSVNAKLNKAINSRNLKLGQPVTAHLTMKLHTTSGVTLPRRTQLIGKVCHIQHGQGKAMSISLIFTRARLKNGRVIPIKATLLGAMPPSYGYSYGAADQFPDSSKSVPSNTQIDQEPGALNHVALHSSVHSQNSGTFKSTRGKIDLRAGTQLRIAIASLQNSTTKAG